MDLFLSYSRESGVRDAPDFGWVKEFCWLLGKELEERLSSQEGPKIYFDRDEFSVADHLEIDLLGAARRSALFMPILSPKYVAKGKFTLRELQAFCSSGNFTNRIVTIDLLPVSEEEGRPPELCGPKRNNFYVHEGKVPIKLNPVFEKQHGYEYSARLQAVAEQIKELLQKMRRDAGVHVEEAKKPFAGKTVLLADMEPDIQRDWEDVSAYLHAFGVTVLAAGGNASG